MKRQNARRRSSTVCVIALLLPFALHAQEQRQEVSSSDALPSEARYLILFRRLTTPPTTNQENPAAPNRARPDYRPILQRSAHLTDDQAHALFRIADDCMQKVTELDQRAGRISAAARAQGRAAAAAGQPLPSPPPELSQLQEEKANAIRNAIEQIRAAFGDQEFKRFDDFVAHEGNGFRAVLPRPDSPSLPVRLTVSLLAQNGQPANRFSANERVSVKVEALNQSTQMISLKPAAVFSWLELSSDQNQPSHFDLLMHLNGANLTDEPPVDVPPTQLTTAGKVELNLKLRPGTYQLVPYKKVLLNRPPNDSVFLSLSLSDPVTFEIVP